MVVYFTFDLLYNIETGYNNRTLLSLQPNF